MPPKKGQSTAKVSGKGKAAASRKKAAPQPRLPPPESTTSSTAADTVTRTSSGRTTTNLHPGELIKKGQPFFDAAADEEDAQKPTRKPRRTVIADPDGERRLEQIKTTTEIETKFREQEALEDLHAMRPELAPTVSRFVDSKLV